MKRDDLAVLKAVAICYKPFLKPEEAMIYCNLGHTQLLKRAAEWGIYKSASGYYKREELDRMMAGVKDRVIGVDKIRIRGYSRGKG